MKKTIILLTSLISTFCYAGLAHPEKKVDPPTVKVESFKINDSDSLNLFINLLSSSTVTFDEILLDINGAKYSCVGTAGGIRCTPPTNLIKDKK